MPSVDVESKIPLLLVARVSSDGDLVEKQAVTRRGHEGHQLFTNLAKNRSTS
jgi:hypothetical protein